MTRSLSRRGVLGAAVAGVTAVAVVAALALTTAGTQPSSRVEPRNHSYLEKLGLADEGETDAEHPLETAGAAGEESDEAKVIADQFNQARLAPYGSVDAGLYGQAWADLENLPASGAAWDEVTDQPYNADAPDFRDPQFSNSGGGAGYVAGRMTGLAVGNGALYAGGAVGGVFRSTDGGSTWTPISDQLPTLSTGDLRYDAASDSLWLATGEANTGAESYVGTGVYRLQDPKRNVFSPSDRVGGDELESRTINALRFDDAGSVYAATSRGLWKHSTAAGAMSNSWKLVLMPNPQDDTNIETPYNNMVMDVAIQPGTRGQRVVANAAWRSGADYNGFYLSTDGGDSFAKVNPKGAIGTNDVGNVQFDYSADGSRLYVVMESPRMLQSGVQSGNSVLAGVYVSRSGDVDGPYSRIATYRKLANSGSALKTAESGKGYSVGVQAWYNNFIAVDPTDRKHVILGLEEVFETYDGGKSWSTIGPYWNFGFDCWAPLDADNTCPNTTHPDQHSVAIDTTHNRLYVGNDGGVYSRPLNNGSVDDLGHATDWTSLNKGLGTLQYYSVSTGKVPGGYAIAGGLQDNGGSLLLPGQSEMVSPFGGDGGDIIVDPNDGCNILDEYVYLTLWMTTNCGRSDGTTSSIFDVSVPDPSPRFTAPFTADTITGDWVAGGQEIWQNTKTWDSEGSDDWTSVYDLGVSNMTVALDSQDGTVYSAWCGTVNCNSAGFTRGIATNYGSAGWHQLDVSALPNRYPSGVTIDPNDPTGATVYVVFNGFNRRFIEGPGSGISGHVFKGHLNAKGDVRWTNVTGNLPDIPCSSIVVLDAEHLVVATDLGVVESTDDGAHWSRVTTSGWTAGKSLPVTTVNDLHVSGDGNLYAATYGRGLWRVPVSNLG